MVKKLLGGALTDNIPMLIAYILGGLLLVWILYRAFWKTSPAPPKKEKFGGCSTCPNKQRVF